MVHIAFLEIKQEIHPAVSILFDFIATAITIVYAILIIVAMVGSGSTGIDDAYMGAVKVGGGPLMILTGYVQMEQHNN